LFDSPEFGISRLHQDNIKTEESEYNKVNNNLSLSMIKQSSDDNCKN